MLKHRRKCFICGNSHGELLFNDPTLGIVISSFEAEDEIYKTIISKVNLKANVIRLHKQE